MKIRATARIVTVIGFVMLRPSSGRAFDPATGQIYLFNTTSCGQYMQDRKLPGNFGAHATDGFYIAGWLSAYNALVPHADISGDTKLDDMMLWLDGFCLNHPFQTMQDGLITFGHQAMPSPRSARPLKKATPSN